MIRLHQPCLSARGHGLFVKDTHIDPTCLRLSKTFFLLCGEKFVGGAGFKVCFGHLFLFLLLFLDLVAQLGRVVHVPCVPGNLRYVLTSLQFTETVGMRDRTEVHIPRHPRSTKLMLDRCHGSGPEPWPSSLLLLHFRIRLRSCQATCLHCPDHTRNHS